MIRTPFLLAALAVGLAVTPAAPADPMPDAARYDQAGRLLFPARYREWIFLSAGLDMRYTAGTAAPTAHVFDNVFAPRAAYATFLATGRWPDGTVLILENRDGASQGSINRAGHFQASVAGVEAHVKDSRRFTGGWGFFAFQGGKPAERIAYTADCYSCHQAHAAVDTTFVQFYPTLLPIATARHTLSRAYLAEEQAAGR